VISRGRTGGAPEVGLGDLQRSDWVISRGQAGGAPEVGLGDLQRSGWVISRGRTGGAPEVGLGDLQRSPRTSADLGVHAVKTLHQLRQKLDHWQV